MGLNDRIRSDRLEAENTQLKTRITELEAEIERLKERIDELDGSYKYELQRSAEAENLHRRLVEALAMTVANHLPKITGEPR
jgi:predicted RNase H-like nuclease (RuvC/YqgF family)